VRFPLALERQTIEKKDFPIGRRGYEPEVVDAHLAQIAEEIDHLKRSSRRRTETLASAASEQVRAIVEAAESSAAEIERQAEDEAREIREDATEEARRCREQAEDRARDYVGSVSESTSVMLGRVDAMESELNALVESLQTGLNRLGADLALLEENMSEVHEATGVGGGFEPEAPEAPSSYSSTTSTLPSAEVGAWSPPAVAEPTYEPPPPEPAWEEPAAPAPHSPEPEPFETEEIGGAVPEFSMTETAHHEAESGSHEPEIAHPETAHHEPDLHGDGETSVAAPVAPDVPAVHPDPRELDESVRAVEAEPDDELDSEPLAARAAVGTRPPAGNADAEGARLIALNMALNGAPRDETDRYLSENFQLDDRSTLLDEVYASVEG